MRGRRPRCSPSRAVALWVAAGRGEGSRALDVCALAIDFLLVAAFTLIFHFERGTPTRQLLFLPLVEGAARFALPGALVVAFASVPIAAWYEQLRSDRFRERYEWNFVTFQLGVMVLMALLVGWLVQKLATQTRQAAVRAEEAEALRDELGRRADILDAAGRCARALGSSLELDRAFDAFIRELRGLVPFHRMAIVLLDGDHARVIATAGVEATERLPPGSTYPLQQNVLADVVATGQPVYREDIADRRYEEESELLRLGVRARVLSPLLVGARPIGLLSVGRAEPSSFSPREVELLALLGRLVATTVQNIRAFEAERRTAEELRRLSTLRADFVSLVSHELRSPMAAVIGSARTLQQRWRELSPEQRESFLGLIADETTRLATLIGDVLDTSRIEAGTFTYTFGRVDLGALIDDAVAAATVGQDEVPVIARHPPALPGVDGDRARLRQVLSNLIDNAVKYSPAGEPVEVTATTSNGRVLVEVSDRGPGIRAEDSQVIFEKFGRAAGGSAKPGTGLGLYIARSIAEAHGGSLAVESTRGARRAVHARPACGVGGTPAPLVRALVGDGAPGADLLDDHAVADRLDGDFDGGVDVLGDDGEPHRRRPHACVLPHRQVHPPRAVLQRALADELQRLVPLVPRRGDVADALVDVARERLVLREPPFLPIVHQAFAVAPASSRSSSRALVATRARRSCGSSSVASPRNDSTSPTSHSVLPTARAPIALPSTSGTAPFSTSHRATAAEYEDPRRRRPAHLPGVEPLARRVRRPQELRLAHPVEAVAPRLVARRGPTCGRTSGAAAARSSTARRFAARPRSPPA